MSQDELRQVTLEHALRMIGDSLLMGNFPLARSILRDVIGSLQADRAVEIATARARATRPRTPAVDPTS